ncbi:MAG: hypothetical protein V3S71_02700 [Acidobacteriota bacterium]
MRYNPIQTGRDLVEEIWASWEEAWIAEDIDTGETVVMNRRSFDRKLIPKGGIQVMLLKPLPDEEGGHLQFDDGGDE